jgi:hypothetical protein
MGRRVPKIVALFVAAFVNVALFAVAPTVLGLAFGAAYAAVAGPPEHQCGGG